MCVGMYVHMHVDMRVDMCVDMCTDAHTPRVWLVPAVEIPTRRPCLHVYMYIDMCVDMCVDTCVDMCADTEGGGGLPCLRASGRRPLSAACLHHEQV